MTAPSTSEQLTPVTAREGRPVSPQMMVKAGAGVALPSAALEKRFADTICSCFDSFKFEQVIALSSASPLLQSVNKNQPLKYFVEDVVFALRKDPTHLKSFVDSMRNANQRARDSARVS